MDRLGLENVKEELERRLGFTLLDARDYHFDHNGDRYGWVKGINGRWHYTMFVEGGRITDYDDYPLMTGIREIAKIHTGDFRLTANQNLIIGNVTSHKRNKSSSSFRSLVCQMDSSTLHCAAVQWPVLLFRHAA